MKFRNLFLLIFLFNNINALDNAVGLDNMGNTCFMNATLQCLFSLDEFNALARQNINEYYKNSISRQYLYLLSSYKRIQSKSFEPKTFCNLMRNKFKLNKEGRQEDAHELITSLLSHLTDEDIKKTNAQLEAELKASFKNLIYIYLQNQFYKNNNIRIGEIIPETVLSIEITGNKLSDCLDSFFSKENLEVETEDGENEKQLKISSLPEYLIIQLKRFKQNMFEEPTKNNKNVTFEKQLNLSKYLDQNIEYQNANYNLIGIIVQSGINLSNGHYFAFAKRNNQWYKFNDSNVEEITNPPLKNISLNETPYLLFYEKKISKPQNTKIKNTKKKENEFKYFILGIKNEFPNMKTKQDKVFFLKQLIKAYGIPKKLKSFIPIYWYFWIFSWPIENPWIDINIIEDLDKINENNVDNFLNVAQQFINNLRKRKSILSDYPEHENKKQRKG